LKINQKFDAANQDGLKPGNPDIRVNRNNKKNKASAVLSTMSRAARSTLACTCNNGIFLIFFLKKSRGE
jgi:hypothetical protein